MQAMKIDQFTEWPFVHSLAVSPKGEKAVFAVSQADQKENTYHTNLWIVRQGEEARPLTYSGKEGDFIFLDENTLLFSSSRDQKPEDSKKSPLHSHYYRLPLNGGEASRAFSLNLTVQSIEKVDSRYLLLSGFYDLKRSLDWTEIEDLPFWLNGPSYITGIRPSLYLFDWEAYDKEQKKKSEEAADSRDREKKKEEDKAEEGQWVAKDPASYLKPLLPENFCLSFFQLSSDKKRVLLCGNYQGPKENMPLQQSLYLLDLASGQFEAVMEESFSIWEANFLPDEEDQILFLAAKQDRHGLNEDPLFYQLDLASHKVQRVSPDDFDQNFGNSLGSDARFEGNLAFKMRPDGFYYIRTRGPQAVLMKFKEGESTVVSDSLPSVEGFDIAEEGDGTIWLTAMKDKLAEVYTLKEGKMSRLTHFSDALDGTALSPVESFHFHSNGTDIQGFVIKPLDFDPRKKYPGLLSVHGGPKTADGDLLFHERQYLAGQGYFVFYTNPHGSDGFGVEYSDIRGHYGDQDYEDLMAFTDAVLARYPQINPDKLGVFGGSYGGFMTNWIIGHTNRFAAANSQRSISNWLSFFGNSDIGNYFANDQTAADPLLSTEKMWAQSPLKYADQVKTPTLFIHSDHDFRCPLEQGLQMYSRLKYNGVDARIVIFKNETHELSRSGRPKGRIKRLTEIREWFDYYLK